MNLGDVTDKTVPKMSLLSPPAHGGAVSTRTFIPHRVHEAIGVLGAVSVATACMLPGSVAHEIAVAQGGDRRPHRYRGRAPHRLLHRHPGGGRVRRRLHGDQVGAAAHRPPAHARRGSRAVVGVEPGMTRVTLIGLGEVGRCSRRTSRPRAIPTCVAWDIAFADPGSPAARAAAALPVAAAACRGHGGQRRRPRRQRRDRGELPSGRGRRGAGPGPRGLVLRPELQLARPEAAGRARRGAGAAARYVEAALMSPIAARRLGLAVPARRPARGRVRAGRRRAGASPASTVYSDEVGRAAATKLCRSVIIKGLESLLTESMLAARHYGVEKEVLDSLSQHPPPADWQAVART